MHRSQQLEVVGVQQPQILHLPSPDVVHSLDDALAAIELANAYPVSGPLDESQTITVVSSMGTRRDGKWSTPSTSDAESRQNGKGDAIQARELYGLTVIGEQIVHTAHEASTSSKAFLRLWSVFEAYDDLRRLVRRPRFANGEQGIEMLSGAMISYRTRTGAGGRGFDAIDLLIIDEAQHLVDEHLAALTPILAVSRNPQRWYAGSAGLSMSESWWKRRMQALRPYDEPAPEVPDLYRGYVSEVTSIGGRFAYIEHTAEIVELDADGDVVSTEPDVEDRTNWLIANPGIARFNDGEGIDYLETQLADLGRDKFAREHLGVWDPLPVKNGVKRAMSKTQWNRQIDPSSSIERRLALAVAVAQDSELSSIGVAGERADGGSHIEVIDQRPGTAWIPERLAGLIKTHKPVAVAIDPAGPEKEILPEVRQAVTKAGKTLVELTARSYAGACGAMLSDTVRERTVWHLAQPWLDAGVAVGKKRKVGESWIWDMRVQAEVVALKAVTVALRASREAPAPVRRRALVATS